MPVTTQLDTLLVQTPNICSGRLRIAGTRVTVNQIATLYQRGESAEEIAEHFPQVTLAQVFVALAHYHGHTSEVEASLAEEAAEAARWQAESTLPGACSWLRCVSTSRSALGIAGSPCLSTSPRKWRDQSGGRVQIATAGMALSVPQRGPQGVGSIPFGQRCERFFDEEINVFGPNGVGFDSPG